LNQADLAAIGALVDTRYTKVALLERAGLRSFIPPLRFQEAFVSSPKELQEYRSFALQSTKFLLGIDNGFSDWFARARDEAAQRCTDTGNSWENDVTSFRRKFKRLMAAPGRKLRALTQPYKEDIERLWQEEAEAFGKGYVDDLLSLGRKPPSRTTLYKNLMGSGLAAEGFQHDAEVSTTRELAYSRQLAKGYKLCFTLDLVNLRQPVGRSFADPNTAEIFPAPGPRFIAWLELRRKMKGTGQGHSERIAGMGLVSVLPIREFPLRTVCYSHVYDLRHLDALLIIHLTMYRLMEQDLSEALDQVC
jgi:hypothetical protein